MDYLSARRNETALAASITLVKSFSVISPSGLATATTPLEFCDSIWLPPIEAIICEAEYPAILSAASKELLIDKTASSISTICPFLIPLRELPKHPKHLPILRQLWQLTVTIFDVPTSIPTTILPSCHKLKGNNRIIVI